jgi:hypothetical protein
VTVYRIVWAPGSDQLVGTCHCGAEHTAEDPERLWRWLLAHPDRHVPPPDGRAAGPNGNPNGGGTR